MATEFKDSEHYGLFFEGGALNGRTSFKVRQSELTLASLRAAGFLDNMVDGTVPPTIDKLWLDKNLDPAILKEWNPVGANWQQVTFQTLFGRVPWRGAWQSSPIYRVGDTVGYNGAIWIAVAPSQNQPPAEDGYWDLFLSSVADDSVTNAKLANVPTGTLKGRVAAGTGDPTDLTMAQAIAALADAGFSVIAPSSYTPTSRTIAYRALDHGINLLEGGLTGGVKPGQGNVAADTAALHNIWNDISSAGGRMFLPGWGYGADRADAPLYFNKKLVLTGKDRVSFYGDSEASTQIFFSDSGTPSDHGFLDLTMETPRQGWLDRVELVNFTCNADFANAGDGIKLLWKNAAGLPLPGVQVGSPTKAFSIRNVHFSPTEKNGPTPKYWSNGIKIVNGREGEVIGCTGFGFDPDLSSGSMPLTNMTSLLSLEGNTVGIIVAHLHAYSMLFPLSISGKCEGIYVMKGQFVTNVDAISLDGDADYMMVCIHLDGCHANSMRGAVRAEGVADMHIRACSFQKRDESADDYADIKLLGRCNTWKIYDNDFRLRGTNGTEVVLTAEGAGNDTVNMMRNTVNNRDAMYVLDANVTNFKIRNNDRMADVTTLGTNLSTSPTNEIRGNNVDVVVPTLAANSATPSLAGMACYDDELMVHTNSNANTSITSFTGIRMGRKYAVRFNESFTGMTHGPNLILAGGVNVDRPAVTPANLGKTFHFVAFSDTQLVETGRS